MYDTRKSSQVEAKAGEAWEHWRGPLRQYDTDDILGEAMNPRIIAKYEKKGDNYNIPAFFK